MKSILRSLLVLGSLMAVRPAAAQQNTIAANLNIAAAGTVTGTGTYNNQEAVTLTATAAPGYEFKNWGEAGTHVSYKNPYTFAATKNRTLVANFRRVFTVSVDVSPVGSGGVEGDDKYYFNDTATLYAADSAGYGFVSWTEDGKFITSNPAYSFTVTRNRALVANFKKVFSITGAVKPSDSVVVAGEIGGDGMYFIKDTVTMEATAAPGYEFRNWTENGTVVSANPTYTFAVSKNRALVANFRRVFVITASISGSGTVTGKGNYYYNDTATLTATPAYGKYFKYWMEGSKIITRYSTLKMRVTGNRNLVAVFSSFSGGRSQIRQGGMIEEGTLIGIFFSFLDKIPRTYDGRELVYLSPLRNPAYK